MNIKENYSKILETLKKSKVYRYTNLETGQEIISTKKENHENFIEEIIQAPVTLVICGGGHVGKALYRMAIFLNFKVCIIDDRAEFCNKEIYPKANIMNDSYLNALEQTKEILTPYYIVATRGHSFDFECVRIILDYNYSYIGMIGSKTKVKYTYDKLRASKVEEEKIKTIHAPIGLEIGGVGPEEIAVSIMAEIIQIYRKSGASFANIELYKKIANLDENFVIARIIKKTGSAPSEVSSSICLFSKGFLGTVGGGEIEHLVLKEAEEMLNFNGEVNSFIKHFSLSSDKAGNIGMTCGGNVDVLFQKAIK